MEKNKKNMDLVKRLFEDVYSQGDISHLDQFFTTDMKLRDPAQPNFTGGLQQYKTIESHYKNAFPTKSMRIDQIYSSEDSIIVNWTCKGTQKGTFMDIPATGKNFTIQGISIYRFKGDKISEISQVWDRLGLLEQLGVMHAHH
jgi:steroid delta-isomerase-like uncharacterized protein